MSADELGITDADREKMAAIAERGTPVDAADCKRWRRQGHNGVDPATIAARDDEVRPESTIAKHASGRCTHDHGVDSVTFDNSIPRTECALIRQFDAQGMPTYKIANVVERSLPTTRRHRDGECRHDLRGANDRGESA